MQKNFEQVYQWVGISEGGYVNHPRDPGGATNKGITQRVYDAWRRNRGYDTQSVREITEKEAKAIYTEQYYDAVWFNKLPSGLDYSVVDFAINSGVSRAVKYLQRIIGVPQDGQMGNVTLAGIHDYIMRNGVETLITQYNQARFDFVRRLSTWDVFGRGWTRRIMGGRIGFQPEDVGVLDRSIMLARGEPLIPSPTKSPFKAGVYAKEPEEPKSLHDQAVEMIQERTRALWAYWKGF